MPKYIQIEPHLTKEALEAGYREAKDGIERSHWQIIWLLTGGKRTREVSTITGYSVAWIRELVRRYNEKGRSALMDSRHSNTGRKRLLGSEQETTLKRLMKQAEQEGQAWNGVQVASWMSQALGRDVHPTRGWEVLRRWGFKQKVPRPRHAKANKVEQDAFKKT